MHTFSNLICIHAKAPDLAFLNDTRNALANSLDCNFRGFRLEDPPSHHDAILELKNPAQAFVVIFAHGGSDYIRGGEYRNRLTRGLCVVDRFLERKDMGVFRGKVVFCMSCQSKELAADALREGAIAFVGFDQIPFHRLDENNNVISDMAFSRHAQRLIAGAIDFCLLGFVEGHLTLDQAVERMRLWICQNAIRFISDPRNGQERHNVAALLLRVKDGLTYSGAREIRFVRNNV